MVNLLATIRLAQSILKRKFPSVDKPRGLFSEFYGITAVYGLEQIMAYI